MKSSTITTDKKTNITYITLENGDLSATFLNYGARWHRFVTPDKDGHKENILLSLDTPESILKDQAQFGAFVGPVAGRIKNARWGDVTLEKNFSNHHIHGGSNGWWAQFWEYEIIESIDSIQVTFSLTDNQSGYPGPIHISNTYKLTETSVIMTTQVSSDSKTIVNPTNHVYFNLSGNSKQSIRQHQLMINSSQILETDSLNIPTGRVLSVDETGYDFRNESLISDNIYQLGKGIDDAYLLQKDSLQITLKESVSRRLLKIYSNREAAVIFSTTGFNDEFLVNRQKMSSELGLAIETQELPDIVNHPTWGSIELSPSETKTFSTTYTIETY